MVSAMSNKRFPKLAVLSLLGVLALASCSESSEIKSKPSNYDDEIITIDGNEEKIHNDIISIIADQIHDGSLPSKTLEKVLYRYAQSIFGAYNKIGQSDNDDTITLKAAAKNARENSADKSVVDNFIRTHKAYWTYDDNGKHVNDDDPTDVKEVTDDKNFDPCISERIRVTSRFDNIEERIAENMFSKISTGSYTTKHFFSEVKYLKALYEDAQNVSNYRDANGELLNIPSIIIDYTVEGKDVFEEGILHRDLYQTNYGLNDDEEADVNGVQYHYIEKEIIPTVYNDLLIEQYLMDEEVAAVRNSRARQINVIKIEEHEGFRFNANLLAKQLVKEIYATVPQSTDEYLSIVDEDHNPFEEIFERYATISKGLYYELYEDDDNDPSTPDVPIDPKADEIIKAINGSRSDAFKVETGTISGKKYFANTTYGDLVEEFEELLSAENFNELDKDLYNKYTDSGKCSFDEGFDQEVINIDQTESITKGWYIQKAAPSLDTNGKIVNNLFQLSIANNKIEIKDENDVEHLEELAAVDRIAKNEATGKWEVRESAADDENKYICSINGAYFLKFDGQAAGSSYTDDILYYDGSAYYVVQVLEAAKDVKLRNKQSLNSYANTRSQEFLNKVVSEITKKVAETGNYASLSKEHWLKKMDIKYHDQSVYDYFKDNYPDLFD